MFVLGDPGATLAGLAIIVFGYVVFGFTGFGASLFTVPVLSHFYPLPLVLALASLLDLAAAITVGAQGRRDAAVRELKWLIPFSLAGAVLGVSLLVSLPRTASLLALGVFIGGYGAYQLASRRKSAPISQAWAPLAGMIGGASGTLFGMGGPPYLLYLARRIEDKNALRATMGVMVWFSLVIRLVVFAAAGVLLQPGIATGLLWFLPAAGLGLWLGNRIHMRAASTGVVRILYGLLIVSGLSLIARALLVTSA
ncbi:MAG: TSUP family transporter [Betaproteobacteria bacterium]|nr:TSUP family transporter [Betaproteobacteria bacterium]